MDGADARQAGTHCEGARAGHGPGSLEQGHAEKKTTQARAKREAERARRKGPSDGGGAEQAFEEDAGDCDPHERMMSEQEQDEEDLR